MTSTPDDSDGRGHLMRALCSRPFAGRDLEVNAWRPAIVALAGLCLVAVCAHYGVQVGRGGHEWKTADWLINFEGGWVRRGLTGQLLHGLSGLGFPLLWSAFWLQVLVHSTVAVLVLRLFFSERRSAGWLALLFSPAFIFLFPLYDMEAGFRKEILVFLSFSLLALGSMKGRLRHPYAAASLGCYALGVFSHELVSLCVLFFVCLLWRFLQANPGERAAGKMYLAGFLALAAAGLLFSAAFRGTERTAQEICLSLQGRGLNPEICGGAIRWLALDSEHAWDRVVIPLPRYLLLYLFPLTAALVPLFLARKPRRLSLWLLACIIPLVPLFVFATDWGRWIHAGFTLAGIMLLTESRREKVFLPKVPIAVVVLYASVWSVPHWIPEGGSGFFGAFSFLARWWGKF